MMEGVPADDLERLAAPEDDGVLTTDGTNVAAADTLDDAPVERVEDSTLVELADLLELGEELLLGDALLECELVELGSAVGVAMEHVVAPGSLTKYEGHAV